MSRWWRSMAAPGSRANGSRAGMEAQPGAPALQRNLSTAVWEAGYRSARQTFRSVEHLAQTPYCRRRESLRLVPARA